MSGAWLNMPLAEGLALLAFVTMWVGYAVFAKAWGKRQSSLLETTNRYRRLWMAQTAQRDPRMLDGIILQSLSQTPAFFSSTSLLVIGALFAVLGTTDKAVELLSDIPFVQRTSLLVFEFKLMVLVAIFVYAFFRFSWCMRQYTFVALVIGGMPPPEALQDEALRERSIDRAAALVGAAADTFNDGLRAYYFSFAALLWLMSPLAMLLGTAVVIAILYRREFHSEVLGILRD